MPGIYDKVARAEQVRARPSTPRWWQTRSSSTPTGCWQSASSTSSTTSTARSSSNTCPSPNRPVSRANWAKKRPGSPLMKVAFAGTSPVAAAAAPRGHPRRGLRRPRPPHPTRTVPGRSAAQLQPSPVKRVGWPPASRCISPKAPHARAAGAARRGAGRRVGGGRLRHHPAPGRARPAAPRLPQHPRRCCRCWRGAAPIHRAIQAGDREPASPSCRWMLASTPGRCCPAPKPSTRRHHRQPPRPPRPAGRRDDRRSCPPARRPHRHAPARRRVTYHAAKIGKAEATVDWNRPACRDRKRAPSAPSTLFPGAVATLQQGTPVAVAAWPSTPPARPAKSCWPKAPGDRRLRRSALCITEPRNRRACVAADFAVRPIAAGSRSTENMLAVEFLRPVHHLIHGRFRHLTSRKDGYPQNVPGNWLKTSILMAGDYIAPLWRDRDDAGRQAGHAVGAWSSAAR